MFCYYTKKKSRGIWLFGYNNGGWRDCFMDRCAVPTTFFSMRKSKMLRNPSLTSWCHFSCNLPLFLLQSSLSSFCCLPVFAQNALAHLTPYHCWFTWPHTLLSTSAKCSIHNQIYTYIHRYGNTPFLSNLGYEHDNDMIINIHF